MRVDQCSRIAGSSKHRDAGEITFLFVVAEEEEHLVFDDWATDSAAKLVATSSGLSASRVETPLTNWLMKVFGLRAPHLLLRLYKKAEP